MFDPNAYTTMVFMADGKIDPVDWPPSVFRDHLDADESRSALPEVLSSVEIGFTEQPEEPDYGGEFVFKFEAHGHEHGDIDVYVFHSCTPHP